MGRCDAVWLLQTDLGHVWTRNNVKNPESMSPLIQVCCKYVEATPCSYRSRASMFHWVRSGHAKTVLNEVKDQVLLGPWSGSAFILLL